MARRLPLEGLALYGGRAGGNRAAIRFARGEHCLGADPRAVRCSSPKEWVANMIPEPDCPTRYRLIAPA